ncbi:MAG TPA: ATPase, T2SS/T4P/T4SS family [Polyangiaceae bacterium]|nr:ATPase, T2SS/T4P/T4SS family [Polyangiaceae bacterium]
MRPLVLHIDDGKGEQRRVEIEAGEQPIWLGRDASCEVVLPAPQVSRKHISLRLNGRQLLVEDHSANGTRVDDSVLRGESRRLHPGRCIMRLGPYSVSFEVPENGGHSASPAAGGSRDSGKAPRARESAPAAREQAAFAHTPQRPRPREVSAPEASPTQRREIHKQLLDYLELPRLDRKQIEDESMRRRVIEALRRIIAEAGDRLPRGVDTERLTQELTDEALGLGPLESLLADQTISEIMVVDPQTIYAETKGKLELTPARFTDNEAVRAAIERIVTPLGRRIDESTPLVDARLKDGSRVNAIIPPLALKGPCITIRKFSKKPLQIPDLIRFGSLNERMARFLTRAVKIRKNIVISGGTGSGKTTLLNVLSGAIPEDERVVTIEDAAELQMAQPHVVSLESRPPNLEGKGAYTIRDLVKNALRMRPDRIVVGECRGSEAIDMLQAMNTGHEGSMTTTHANSPREAIARIETLCLMAGVDLPVRAIRSQIASSVHLIVQQSRLADGSRRVTAVSEVTGIDDDGEVELNEIYSFVRLSTDASGRIQGEFRASGYLPSFIDQLITSNVAPEGDFV